MPDQTAALILVRCCPFCDGNPVHFEGLNRAYLHCETCLARGPEAFDLEGAVGMWNDRGGLTEDPVAVAMRKLLSRSVELL